MNIQKNNKAVIITINMVISFFSETFVGMALGFFLGRYFDNLLFDGERMILAYVLLFLGLFAGLINFIKRVLKNIAKEEKNEKS